MSNNTVVNDRGQSHPRGVKWQKNWGENDHFKKYIFEYK